MSVNSHENKIAGSVLALAMGDALGAAHEGGPLEQIVWHIIGRHGGRWRWTDDTQMSIDVIESLIEWGEVRQDDLAGRFARSYRWSRGYGPGAAKILKKIANGMPWDQANRSVYKDGSFGNGAAMRAAPIGLFFARASMDAMTEATRKISQITHTHPLGIEGATLIAATAAMAYLDTDSEQILRGLDPLGKSPVFREKLHTAGSWLQDSTPSSPDKVRSELGNGIAAASSCVTAIYCALAHRNHPFEELLAFVRRLGGDVDTIGAMSGAIWGATNGADALPKDLLLQVERNKYLAHLATALALKIRQTHPTP